MVGDQLEDDEVEMISDTPNTHHRKITKQSRSLIYTTSNLYFSKEYLGFINNHYEFVSPNVELSDCEEKDTMDKLNIFKAFTANKSKTKKEGCKIIALDIIREIVAYEVSKYRYNYKYEKMSKSILNYDSIMSRRK